MNNITPQPDHQPHAGEISSREAWKMLKEEKEAQLVDVRTVPEWGFVGMPNLSSLGKEAVMLSWRTFPTMDINGDFVEQLKQHAPDVNTPLLFLCKTGGRSHDAAEVATKAGYARCYNVADGFEGAMNEQQQRGSVDGWKAAKLPWIQR